MKSYSIHYHKYNIFAKLDKNTWIDETKTFDVYGKKVWEKTNENIQ